MSRIQHALGSGILFVSVGGLIAPALGLSYPPEAQWVAAAIGIVAGFALLASCDTHPKDGDSTKIEAPLGSGATAESRDAQ